MLELLKRWCGERYSGGNDMRLYIVTANWGKGGPGGIAADLYNVASENGWECRFAYARETIPSWVNSYRIGTKLTPYIHAASSMVFDNAGFVTKKSTIKLVEDIEKYKPDVINLHNPLGYSMNVEILFDYFKTSRIPVVWTIHDIWSITGHCIAGLCDNWKNGCGKCPNKREYPASYVFDRSKQNRIRKKNCFSNVPKMTLVSPSKWLKNLVEDTYLNQYDIEMIPNGIDLNIFKPTESSLRKEYHLEGKIVLLAVAGVWTKNKGARYFYELSSRLDDQYVFVMIGENSDKELKNNKRIIHIPHTSDRTQLAQWYTTVDVLINPTMGDNFPTVNLEAIACGTPVITFDTGGSGEAIRECGIVVPQEDVEKMQNAVFALVGDSNQKERCSSVARRYDRNKKYNEYLKLFKSVSNITN